MLSLHPHMYMYTACAHVWVTGIPAMGHHLVCLDWFKCSGCGRVCVLWAVLYKGQCYTKGHTWIRRVLQLLAGLSWSVKSARRLSEWLMSVWSSSYRVWCNFDEPPRPQLVWLDPSSLMPPISGQPWTAFLLRAHSGILWCFAFLPIPANFVVTVATKWKSWQRGVLIKRK